MGGGRLLTVPGPEYTLVIQGGQNFSAHGQERLIQEGLMLCMFGTETKRKKI